MKEEIPLYKYDVKVLLALVKTLRGDKLFFKFLLENGFTELAAWSNAIRGDVEALKWLLTQGHPSLGVLSNAIDGDKKAVEWIENTKDEFLINFASACRGEKQGYIWLKQKNLTIFVYMVTEIREILKVQMKENTFWYKWR